MRNRLCAWLALSAGLLVPAIAHAEDEPKPYPECTKTPTDSETAAAKGAYQAGNASFDEADYPRAITYWEDAYRRDCTANLLLKNLARAYELYGQKRQAVVALETFLVREPNANDKDQIQRRIEVLKNQIASEKAAPPAGTGTQPPPATPPPATPQPQPATTGLVSLSPTQKGKRPILPLIVTGVGGVVTIVGIAVYAKGAKDAKHYEDLCPNRFCDMSKPNYQSLIDGGNNARTREIAGGVVTGIGVATIAGGLIWYFLAPRSSVVTTASAGTLRHPLVTPAVAPGFSGVALSGAF